MKAITTAIFLFVTGASVEYRVQRIRQKKDGSSTHLDGTTVLRTASYRAASKKYRALRVADTDTVCIRAVVTTNQRHGSGVVAS